MFGSASLVLVFETILILVCVISLSMAEIGPDLVVQTTKGKVQGMNLMTAHGRQAKIIYIRW